MRAAYRYLLTIALSTCSLLPLAGCASESNARRVGETASADGRFIATYERASTQDNAVEARLWKERKLLEDFVEAMNSYIRIPRDIKVIAKECGESNAYFDPETSSIEMCYEMSAEERARFEAAGDAAEDIDNALYQSAVGTLYHELGHALISELELKITGREEDVADQLAAYVLTADEESRQFLVAVADTYVLSAQEQTHIEDLPTAGTHSLDFQRAVNFLCYLYGSDASTFGYLVKDGTLPEERAENCEHEHGQLADAWDSLLKPHLKPE
ncbi:DUF4344 domain-containing metallopeptidase [Stenotrophomonas maltophilia]|uniref:DUF4344 domain-containing metallopeptidase n=1 Tax=Stenotrophomonas maltophilia TaxID=40324 RepID=UPI0015DCF5D9|nr:DUF4344 domain-containing metallopeptidase [Stenotrophomonas maltophilia]QDL27898.1 hypothetical protein EGM71_09140 [Stenotrophomonas maltophilia]